MSRPISPVPAAAFASVVAMTAFALWTSSVRLETARTCFGPGCTAALASDSGHPRKALGLIDL